MDGIFLHSRVLSALLIGLSLGIGTTYSDTTDVYCVHPQDNTAWYWLADGNYHISGTEKPFVYHQRVYWGFYVKEEDYQTAKSACYDGWYPQPAYSRFSGWQNFLVETESKTQHLAPGFLSDSLFNDRMLEPSFNFYPLGQCSYQQPPRVMLWQCINP